MAVGKKFWYTPLLLSEEPSEEVHVFMFFSLERKSDKGLMPLQRKM